jgi:hypothetical protein
MLIQKLVLDFIVNNKISTNSPVMYFSKNQLASRLGLVKQEYRTYFNAKQQLSELLSINLEVVDEFYRMTDGKTSGYISTALKALEKKSVIQYQDGVILIKEGYFGGIREATDTEVEAIVGFENKILAQMTLLYPTFKSDTMDRKDVFLKNKWKEFTDAVYNEIRGSKYSYIKFYFRGIKIVTGSEIVNSKERLDRFISNNRTEIKAELNLLFVDNYKDSYSRLCADAKKKLLTSDAKTYHQMRAYDSYAYSGHELISATIDKNENFTNVCERNAILVDDSDNIPFMN